MTIMNEQKGDDMAENMMQHSRIRPITKHTVAQARHIVAAGGLIAVPTDTVYGVACDPMNVDAVGKLFSVKHRPRAKSIQVLLPSLRWLGELGLELPSPLDILAAAFLPGGFSPIARVLTSGTPLATAKKDKGWDTQAIRIPDCEPLSRILAATGPLACTSANLSGKTSAMTAQEAYDALGDSVELYLDGGPTASTLASTVVACDPDDPQSVHVLREGVIPAALIRQYVAQTIPSRFRIDNGDEGSETK